MYNVQFTGKRTGETTGKGRERKGTLGPSCFCSCFFVMYIELYIVLVINRKRELVVLFSLFYDIIHWRFELLAFGLDV